MKKKSPIKLVKKLSEKDNDTIIKLNTDDQLEIKLEGNPSTGYTWELISMDQNLLIQIGIPRSKSASLLFGSGSDTTLIFQAINAGQSILQLAYHRTWEKEVPFEKTFRLIIMII